jgi:hypothetical protein
LPNDTKKAYIDTVVQALVLPSRNCLTISEELAAIFPRACPDRARQNGGFW